MGTTRDHVDDRQCHNCAEDGQANLRAQVDEIPELLTIAHMQGAEHAKDQVKALKARVEELEAAVLRDENELATVLPEDYGAVEYIAYIQKRMEKLETALNRIATETHTRLYLQDIAREALHR